MNTKAEYKKASTPSKRTLPAPFKVNVPDPDPVPVPVLVGEGVPGTFNEVDVGKAATVAEEPAPAINIFFSPAPGVPQANF